MSALVTLFPRKKRTHYRPENHNDVDLIKSLPFFKSKAGNYVHRIRSGTNYYRDGDLSHTAFQLWCGMVGLASENRRSKLMSELPANSIVCATCEGRAIGAGQTDSHKIAGHFVKYSPKL